MNVGYLIAAVSLITAAAVIAAERGKSARLLRRMDKMLEQAMTQGFTEQDYDESMLSSVETKLARYLASSSVSARNLQEEKDKIKTLVADISHQTKTPLANILLYTQLLAEKPLDGESRECVERLEGQAEKLRSLIEALVKTSRLESGVLALQPRPSPLAPMLREAVTQFAPAAEEKGISLTLASSDGDGTFDPKWTAEAVCNLIDNAVKYTPPGGGVTVNTRCYEMFCRVDVSDTGPGIPETEQAKIFRRFYRRSENSQIQGVGIGLYLARQIAERQGGYIKLSSRAGEGSTFSLYLPRN